MYPFISFSEMPKLYKSDFYAIAMLLKHVQFCLETKDFKDLVDNFAVFLQSTNDKFDEEKFKEECYSLKSFDNFYTR